MAETSHLTSVVLLGYRRDTVSGDADGRTLLNLMLLRRELDARGGDVRPRVLVELLDAESVELAGMTGADDYLVSDAIGSRMIAQLAEQPERRAVYLSLYATEGPSVHLVNASDLGLSGDSDAGHVFDVAYAAGLLAIGWRRSLDRGGEVVLNPRTSEMVRLEGGDQIVVVG
jgi:hypothetical protein